MKSTSLPMRTLFSNSYMKLLLLGVAILLLRYFVLLIQLVIEYKVSIDFLTKPLALALVAAAFLYGVARVIVVHPVFDHEYSQWLASTPWTPIHPLPKGPLHLVWPDFFVIGSISFLCYLLTWTIAPPMWPYVLGPVFFFAMALALVWTIANFCTGNTIHVYIVVPDKSLFVTIMVNCASFRLSVMGSVDEA